MLRRWPIVFAFVSFVFAGQAPNVDAYPLCCQITTGGCIDDLDHLACINSFNTPKAGKCIKDYCTIQKVPVMGPAGDTALASLFLLGGAYLLKRRRAS
jgi:hypothetical protein